MPLVTYKDLCLDFTDPRSGARFWADALGLRLHTYDDGDLRLDGPTPQHVVWPNEVAEPHEVKNRVHLDVWATSHDDLPGATAVSAPGEFAWTTMVDPEGNDFCVFAVDDPPDYRLKDVVVDAVDHVAISRWWAEVWGGTLVHDDSGYSYLDAVPGVPFESFDFVPVPEPKTVKNRVHWDVVLAQGVAVADLLAVGASVVAEPTDEDPWTVLADPEGNEFCVFPR